MLSWDDEQGICVTFERGDEAVYVEIEERNDALRCYGRTRRFNVNARPVRSSSRDVGASGRPLMTWFLEALAAGESAFPEYARARTARRADMREILVERMLVPESRGQYYINPYVGCVIGCPYCYIAPRADLSRKLEGLPEIPWGRYVDVKMNAAEVLAREVREHEPGIVRLSPVVTDPYQPAERKYRITRQCLEVLHEARYTPCILTRGYRVVEDIDLLRRFPRAMAGFSIPTDDDRIRRLFEPGADPIEQRIDGMRRLRQAGVVTLLVVQPMLPMNPDRYIELLGPWADIVRIDRMHFDGAAEVYHRNGLDWARTAEFFEKTRARLLAGFASYGAIADEMDDMAALLELARSGAQVPA